MGRCSHAPQSLEKIFSVNFRINILAHRFAKPHRGWDADTTLLVFSNQTKRTVYYTTHSYMVNENSFSVCECVWVYKVLHTSITTTPLLKLRAIATSDIAWTLSPIWAEKWRTVVLPPFAPCTVTFILFEDPATNRKSSLRIMMRIWALICFFCLVYFHYHL